jgi:CheY-like chemotaxis protein
VRSEHEQLNILVIDDDEALRGLLVDVVARSGHLAFPAASAEEGLSLLPYHAFQIAFIDQGLPGMEGLVLGEYFRRNNPDMTIALVTGSEDKRLARATLALSITYIRKPFDLRAIERVIEEYIAGARSRAASRRQKDDARWAPPVAEYAGEIGASYDVPGVPARLADRLCVTIKRCLNDLRSVGRYTERDRVVALAGLLAARVLGLDLPKLPSGRSLYEEYDEIMRQHGRRTEFE